MSKLSHTELVELRRRFWDEHLPRLDLLCGGDRDDLEFETQTVLLNLYIELRQRLPVPAMPLMGVRKPPPRQRRAKRATADATQTG